MTPIRTQAFAASLAIALAACGSGDSGAAGDGLEEQAAKKDRVAISVSPQTLSLVTGATEQLFAAVSGTENTTVIWTVDEGAAGGSVSSTGLYTAPSAAGTYRVVATSQFDSRKSAVATVTVAAPDATQPPASEPVPPPTSDPVPPSSTPTPTPTATPTPTPTATPAPSPSPSPSPIAVSVSPPSTSLPAGSGQQFTATVSGTTNTSVVWTIQEGPVAGSLSSTGYFTASAAPGTYRIVATSQVDPTKSAVAQVTVGAAATSGIPGDRTTSWRPGIPGGVPSRTTVCATISAATYGNGSTDATWAIQSAIDSCPANQVVYLPAGTYRISNTINLNRSVVLRGAGANSTTLLRSPGGRGVQMGNWTSRGTGVNLTANAPKGATSLTVADASPFAVGDIVSIDQVDDPAVVQGTTCVWMKRGSAGAWRSIGQMVEITGKSGNTLTLASPLHWTFTTGLRAQLVPLSPKPTRYAGLEDLRISGASGHGVNVLYAAYSWIKGVETDRVDGIHVTLDGTYRFILRDSYAHHSMQYAYGGGSYGYSLESQASDNLVENNIVYYMNKPIQFRNSGGGNVVAYNYVDDSWAQPDSSGNVYFQELSIDSHCAFSHMELVEGNYAPHMGVAATWGNAGSITYFRNQATSVFRTFKPTMNQSAIQLDARSSDMNVVGNVLGAPGLAGTTYQSTDAGNCRNSAPFIYRFNYDSSTGYCTFPSPVDYRASNSVLRHGNFDYATNSVQWSPTTSSRTLPSSLYLTSKPAFFGANPWPWVDPASASRVYSLPAKARFDAGRPNG